MTVSFTAFRSTIDDDRFFFIVKRMNYVLFPLGICQYLFEHLPFSIFDESSDKMVSAITVLLIIILKLTYFL